MKTTASVRKPPMPERRASASRIASGVAKPKQIDQTRSVTTRPPHWLDGTVGGNNVPDISVQLRPMTANQATSSRLRQNRGCALKNRSASNSSMTSNGRHCRTGG